MKSVRAAIRWLLSPLYCKRGLHRWALMTPPLGENHYLCLDCHRCVTIEEYRST